MTDEQRTAEVVCKTTRYGEGCFHPVKEHNGSGACCCCSGRHNEPAHIATCQGDETDGVAHCRTRFKEGVIHEHHNWHGRIHVYHCPGGEPPEPRYMDALDPDEQAGH